MHLPKSSIVRVCGAAAALFLFGCGSSSSSGDPAANFAGTWTFGSGSIDATCNIAIPSFPLTGDTMTITRVDPTHVAVMLMGNGLMCSPNFTVTGSTATATSGQTCSVTTTVAAMSVTALITINSWSLNVSGDTLTNSMSGTATAASGVVSCTTVTADGMATRTSDGGTGG